jgi:RNA-directed DNA polymerase
MFLYVSRHYSAEYVLEADIKSCFDSISHQWLLGNIPMDRKMLSKWLAAGYIEKDELHPTLVGTPQGGTISPTLLVITLSGLEQVIKNVVKVQDKVYTCIYADDFVVSGATEQVLEERVKPAIASFLSERGLTLSAEKTKIIHISKGFDFLGMNIRKYKGKLIIKPTKSGVQRLMANVRGKIKANKTAKASSLIQTVNPMLRGWANYYQHVCSKETFYYIDHKIVHAILRWAIRRHPNKGLKWVCKKYFRNNGKRSWVFHDRIKDKDGKQALIDLVQMAATPIKRHIKVISAATIYDPCYEQYFATRHQKMKRGPETLRNKNRAIRLK